MDRLPLELFQLIFQNLEITELFDLRLVNKRLNYAVSEFRMKELIFATNYQYRFNWSFSRQSINHLNVLPVTKQFILRSDQFNTKSLRFLKINLSSHKYRGVKLSNINQFVHLTQLEIDAGCYSADDCLLSLPNLKVLCFAIAGVRQTPGFTLDLPNLEKLDVLDLYGVTVKHPLTVKHLKCQYMEPNLACFKNIELLECFHLTNPGPKSKNLDLLTIFPQLKQLLVEKDPNKGLKQIIAEKARLEKLDLKIYFRSLECLTYDDLKTYREKSYYLDYYTLDQHFKMYPKLADNLDFVDELDFSLLTCRFRSIPIDFFEKYPNINKLFLHGRTDQKRFLSFIAGCANLGYLSISHSELDNAFYDQLPGIAMLIELHIIESNDDRSWADLDTGFVCRMKSLRVFNSNLQLNTTEVRRLCSSEAGHLEKFGVAANGNVLHVERTHEEKCCLKNENNLKLFNEEIDFDMLISWIDFLKKDVKSSRSAFKRFRTTQ